MLEVITCVWNECIRFLINTFSSLIVSAVSTTVPKPVPPCVMYVEGETALAVRDTLYYSAIDFKDHVLTTDEYDQSIRSKFPFQHGPVLHINDEAKTIITQSKSMLRYASRLARTYPSNAVNAAVIDEWCDLQTEFMMPVTACMHPERFGLDGHDKKGQSEYIVKTHIPQYMRHLNEELEDSMWLGDFDQPTMADFCWYSTIKWLKSGEFESIQETFFAAFPHIKRFIKDMEFYDDDDETEDETVDETVDETELSAVQETEGVQKKNE